MDTDKKTVTFDDGSVQSYDQLLISTGCRLAANTQSPSLSGVPCHHPSSLYCANVELDNIIIMATTDKKTYLVKLKKIKDVWLRCTPLFCYSSLKSQMFRMVTTKYAISLIPNICHLVDAHILNLSLNFLIINKIINRKVKYILRGAS